LREGIEGRGCLEQALPQPLPQAGGEDHAKRI
jgi:hypothetical protein